MESNRELEMSGIASDAYDISHPTPVPLKELSAIAVSLEIWRCKANEYRDNRKLKEFCPSDERIVLKKMLPDLPTVIYTAIDKYVTRFGPSMENWLKEHHSRIFYFYYTDHQNFVLDYFDNFVCDYTGTIDYLRTARRMMYYDRFDENQKFVIACTYFFEDDIRRLWPLLSKNMHLNGINFSKSSQLYYWICCLRKELDRIPSAEINDSVEEVMLNEFMSLNRPSVEYFWNRLPLGNRMRRAFIIFTRDGLSFARFILPKLNDQQLEEFVSRKGYELMYNLFKNFWYDKELIWPIWIYIKKAINADGFTKLVVKMLENELFLKIGIWFDLYCEIWISAPENLKRSVVAEITSNMMLFSNSTIRTSFIPPRPKEFKFLSTFLLDTTSAERRSFWFHYWEELVKYAPCKDLAKIMKLCFENENEIAQFKENVMANRDRVRCFYKTLLLCSCFDELNDVANFLWSDIRAARSFKRKLLRLAFLERGPSFDTSNHATTRIRKTKEFNKFIEDAFANVDLSTDFKNRLMSSPEMQRELSQSAFLVPFEQLVEFIDTFVSAENTLLEIKARIIDELKERAAYRKSSIPQSSLTPLLSWCLGSKEEIAKFKENYLQYAIPSSVTPRAVIPTCKPVPRGISKSINISCKRFFP